VLNLEGIPQNEMARNRQPGRGAALDDLHDVDPRPRDETRPVGKERRKAFWKVST
jgi:hypothetical protein